jgi:hypothetical protein
MECMDTTKSPPADSASGTGKLKSSILSAITSCRVNGMRGEFGQWRIETEELRRNWQKHGQAHQWPNSAWRI